MPSGQPPSSNSIIFGNCIACEGLVRLPSKASATAKVRCPHCQKTFSLATLLESAVPEVEVVGSDSPPTAATTTTATPPEKRDLYIDQNVETSKDAAGKFVVPSQLAKGARRRKSSRSSRSSSHRSDSDSSSREGRSDSDHRSSSRTSSREEFREARSMDNSRNVAAERPRESSERFDVSSHPQDNHDGSHRSTRHRDKREQEASELEPNPVTTVLKVFAGGALALPIAYMIVMWVFSQDPLGIGKQIGDKVPFMVPAALRAETEEKPKSPSDENTNFEIGGANSDLLSPRVIEPDIGGLNIGSEALEGLNK